MRDGVIVGLLFGLWWWGLCITRDVRHIRLLLERKR